MEVRPFPFALPRTGTPTSPQVLNPRAALLSNFEVLTLLRELEHDHLQRTKTALRIKKEEDNITSNTGSKDPTIEDVCENLRTVAVEVSIYPGCRRSVVG